MGCVAPGAPSSEACPPVPASPDLWARPETCSSCDSLPVSGPQRPRL